MLTIIDNKMGNIESVANALSSLNIQYSVSSDKKAIEQATSLILPGVGAFSMAMDNLKKLSLNRVLVDSLLNKNIPFLGICLGMQLLFEKSNEQKNTVGLGIMNGSVTRIKNRKDFLVPHVGWNGVELTKKNPLFENIDLDARFYYDHSYFVNQEDENSFASLHYSENMSVGACKGNIFGVQFHPEKSQRNGLKLLRNFVNYSERVVGC